MPFSNTRWVFVGVVGLLIGCGAVDDDASSVELAQETTDDALIDATIEETSDVSESVDAGTDEIDAGEEVDAGGGAVDEVVRPPVERAPYVVNVRANGTGCKPGTWDASISPDRQTIKVTFSEYETWLTPQVSIGSKDCLISVQMQSPSGFSFAVIEFAYAGYALLEKGVTGFQTAKYYFAGMPIGPERRTDLKGPFDDDYKFVDRVTPAELIWSPCGLDRLVHIQTRIQVRRQSGKGEGYMNLAMVDGTMKGELTLKLALRKC